MHCDHGIVASPDDDLDILRIGWSHDRVLLYENQGIDWSRVS